MWAFKSALLSLLLLTSFAFAKAPPFLEIIQTHVEQDPDFNNTYSKSGCFIRAHWMAEMIWKTHHTPLKVFVQTLDLKEKMKIKLLNGKDALWVFHVTAGYKDEADQVWVIDPILFDKPITMQSWLQHLKAQTPQVSLTVSVTGPEIYHVDSEENAEFSHVSKEGPFSERAMSFIKDGMNILFLWESFD